MNNTNFIKKYLTTILGGVAILSMAFKFISITTTIDVPGMESKGTVSVTGFTMLNTGFWAYLLLAMPCIIILASLIKQCEPYRKLIYIFVPVFTIIDLFLFIPGAYKSMTAGAGDSMKITVFPSLGGWIMLVCMAIIVLSVLRESPEAEDYVSDFNELISMDDEQPQDISTNPVQQNASPVHQPINEQDSAELQQQHYTQNSPAKPVSQNSATTPVTQANPDEILEQVKKLHAMMVDGILTEEEFITKKTKLLEKI